MKLDPRFIPAMQTLLDAYKEDRADKLEKCPLCFCNACWTCWECPWSVYEDAHCSSSDAGHLRMKGHPSSKKEQEAWRVRRIEELTRWIARAKSENGL